ACRSKRAGKCVARDRRAIQHHGRTSLSVRIAFLSGASRQLLPRHRTRGGRVRAGSADKAVAEAELRTASRVDRATLWLFARPPAALESSSSGQISLGAGHQASTGTSSAGESRAERAATKIHPCARDRLSGFGSQGASDDLGPRASRFLRAGAQRL